MSIQRTIHTEEARSSVTADFSNLITKELEGRLSKKRNLAALKASASAPLSDLVKADASARSALKALEPMLEEERYRYRNMKRPAKPRIASNLSITTNGNLVVSTPPYDLWWKTGNVLFTEADLNAGTFKAETIDDSGYSAAGLGLFVSSTIPQTVRFSAEAEFHSLWTDFVIEGGSNTEGGVGVLVSEGGNVIARRDATLWSDSQVGMGSPWLGASGDDVTLLTQTAAGQTYFHMIPGRNYVVWVWGWTMAHTLGSVFAFAELEARMPFVVVEQQR
jgi:hypothetical protein